MLECMQESADNAAVAGTLCHGSPWISGPLVGPSCPTAQTASGRGLRADSSAGIGGNWSGPAQQGHDGLPAANCEASASTDPQEIHHDQNQTLSDFIRGRGAFCSRQKSADFPGIELPHARTWRAIRERCDTRAASDCAFPFCRCRSTKPEKAPAMNAREPDTRGDSEKNPKPETAKARAA
jgi:hypothetical protein